MTIVAAVRILAILALAIVQIQAARVQTQEVHAALSSASSSKANFKCPSECLECCDSTGVFGKAGLSDRTFKCVLWKKTEMPKDVQCEEPSPRKGRVLSNGVQYKTQCKYADSGAKALPKCSTSYKCCCDTWPEARCIKSQKDILQAKANNTGKMETFKRSPVQSRDNKDEPCQVPGNEHHQYDSSRVPGSSESPVRYLDHRKRTKGCCLQTRSETVEHRWTTEHEEWCQGPCIGPRHVEKVHHETKTYTVCVKHEQLHYCSDDHGLTSNGKTLYDSHSKQEGVCLGDEQSEQAAGDYRLMFGRCPMGAKSASEASHVYLGSDWCQCRESCGRHKRQV